MHSISQNWWEVCSLWFSTAIFFFFFFFLLLFGPGKCSFWLVSWQFFPSFFWRPQIHKLSDTTQFSQTFKALKSLSYFPQTFKDRANPVCMCLSLVSERKWDSEMDGGGGGGGFKQAQTEMKKREKVCACLHVHVCALYQYILIYIYIYILCVCVCVHARVLVLKYLSVGVGMCSQL